MGIGLISELSNFYYKKKVLVTGHTGFKGTWLCLWLNLMGAKICGFSLTPGLENTFFNMVGAEHFYRSDFGDIRNIDGLKKVISDFKPEIVIHLAAQSLVKKSYADPVETYTSNIMGTVNLLETIRMDSNVRAVINVTSDKCYENKNWLWGYRENDPLGGQDPYSSSKACSEIITSAYIRSFFSSPLAGNEYPTAIASARAGNVIGGGDFAVDRLIPDLVRSFIKKEAVHIRYPKATRPWQYVLEPLLGYLILAKNLFEQGVQFSGAWNFGPRGDGIAEVESIVTKFISIWGEDAKWTSDLKAHPYEASLLKLDSSKAQDSLGWKTRLTIDQTVRWTADWYKIFRECPEKISEFSNNQIKAYETILDEIY